MTVNHSGSRRRVGFTPPAQTSRTSADKVGESATPKTSPACWTHCRTAVRSPLHAFPRRFSTPPRVCFAPII
jgi:hypothetical protein